MNAIDFNNKERAKALGSEPAASMTKRELMATEAMAALIQSKFQNPDDLAELAIKMADALIEGLNR